MTAVGYVDGDPRSDGLQYLTIQAGFRSSNPDTYNDFTTWRIDAWTKANGAVGTPTRYHGFKYSAGTWAHSDKGDLADALNGPVTEVWLGAISGAETLNGRLGAVAVFDAVLADATIEGLTVALADWMALNPVACWKFDTDDVVSGAVDITGNGANETSHSGTSFSADEPPGFDYSLTNDEGSRFMPFFMSGGLT